VQKKVSQLFNLIISLEHIKYPDSSKGPPPGAAVPPGSQNAARKPSVTAQNPKVSTAHLNGRSMSPAVGSDNEDPRRAMSPAGRSIKSATGLPQQTFPTPPNGKGKAPVRPRREDDDLVGTDDGMDTGTSESYSQRATSPDSNPSQARAKSPVQFNVASRAVSPINNAGDAFAQGGQPPSMVAVSMGINGVTGRSSPAVTGRASPLLGRASPVTGRASPALERVKASGDVYSTPQITPPIVNGFARPTSKSGNGSVGNVAADLLKDLKAKDLELDSLKRQMIWMREVLSKASRAGYVQVDREGSPDLSLSGATEDGNGGRYSELALKFKQFKSQVQASRRSLNTLLIGSDFF
jgi:hypothetical protein